MHTAKSLWDHITRHISLSRKEDQVFVSTAKVNGGDIAEAFVLECRNARYFVKLQSRKYAEMFKCEYESLTTLAKHLLPEEHHACPHPICAGENQQWAYLVMEFVDLSGSKREDRLGRLVAQLHKHHKPERHYGWVSDNYIGLAKQRNTWTATWADFFWQQRLAPQLELALRTSARKALKNFEKTLEPAVYAQLQSHTPAASLLHGDLWAGNKGYSPEGCAYIFDPATYYGDAETDIALSELFGGFEHSFYQSYYAERAKKEGYEKRRDIYQLYHLLNHLNLFGDSYLSPCVRTMKSIQLNCPV